MGELAELLRGNAWLGSLEPDTLAELASSAIVRRLADGELWVSRSEAAPGLAVIVAGGLRSTTFTEEGREYVFSIMKKGDVWGLVSTVDGGKNANDVYTHGQTTLIFIDRQTALKSLATHTDFNRCVMEMLCQRLRMANAVLEDRALKPLSARLARLLLSLRASERNDAGHDPHPRVTVTQDMLARILGCTRPTINKQLREFEKLGLVRLSYGRIDIANEERLSALSGDSTVSYF